MQYEAIVIGVSSGGLEAVKKLFAGLPAVFRIPIVIVQHLSPRSDSRWIQLLDERSALHIKELDEKEKMQNNTAYFAPPNYHVLIEKDHTFTLSADARVNFARPSIDVLFESAADVFGEHLVGIVLTGSNRDGAQGLKKIKQCGGLTIAEDPATATSPEMPAAAIKAAKPHHILPLPQIIELLVKLDTNTTLHQP